MPAPKYNELQESWGWKFECGSCDHNWWLNLASEQTDSKKRTGTNDMYLNSTYTDDEFYERHFRDAQSSPYTRTQHTYSNEARKEISNLPVLAIKDEKGALHKLSAPPMPHQNINYALSQKKEEKASIFWISFTFLIFTLCSILYVYQDVFHQKWLRLKISNPMMQSSAISLPLLIQHVHWDKIVMPDGKVKVAIIGEVFNNNKMLSRLRPLHMIAWAPCNQVDKTQEKCMAGSFEYTFPQPTILPQEHVTFKATWVLPKDSVVTAINVTLLP